MSPPRIVQAVLSRPEISYALSLTHIDVDPASPLAWPEAGSDGAVQAEGSLSRRGLVVPGTPPRLHRLFAIALAVAARPDLVVRLQTDGRGRPGMILCRRAGFVAECTPGPGGFVTIAFPLTPGLAARALAEPLGGPDGVAPFHFAGDAVEVAVLKIVIDADHASRPPRSTEVVELARAAIADPAVFAPLVLLGGGPELVDASASADSVAFAVSTLIAAGHIVEVGGAVHPSAAVRAALGGGWEGGVTVDRATRGAGGARSLAYLTRCGGTTLLFRRTTNGPRARFEWTAVGRAQARALLMASVFTDQELSAAV